MATLVPSSKTLRSTLLLLFLTALHLSRIEAHGGDDHAGSDSEHVDLHSRGLILVKIWCLIILFVSTFAGGVSPYFYRWNETFLLLGTQFAAGVFLGTSMIHFLSDADETFDDLTTKEYPFAFMLACAGYLLTMLGDCIVVFVSRSSEGEARVVEIEGGKTPEEQAHEVGMEVNNNNNPIFVKTSNVGDTVLLILALCFHSVFEGIAVGVAGITMLFLF